MKGLPVTYNINELLYIAFEFHGHQCPAIVLGVRAGLAAMKALGVERSKDLELYLISETGRDHAGGCFLDGLMAATGCTYGKSNIEKTYCDKFAFTLIDVSKHKAVRVGLKSEQVELMMQSRFAKERSQGKKLEEMPQALLAPVMASALTKAEANFLDIHPVDDWEWSRTPKVYETGHCDQCHELTFVSKLIEKDGKRYCPCCYQTLYG